MAKKDILKELILAAQEAFGRSLFQREVEIPLHSGKIVVLKGVRRSGKTEALHLAIQRVLAEGVPVEKILLLNFDDERIPFSAGEFDLILQAYRELYPEIGLEEVYFFFDEIQVSDGWEQFVRRVYDQASKNIFITGSNSKLLSSEIATSLRGRTLQYEIFPLSYGEYCSFKGIERNILRPADRARMVHGFQDYLYQGAFPELVDSNYLFSDRILQEYYHVMLYRDLVERYEIKNLPAIKYFIRRILANISKPTSINKIFNELKSAGIKVGKNTLYDWVDALEAIYFFMGVPPYDPSLVKENTGSRKYYCIDTGFEKALSSSPGRKSGVLLENAVFLWLRRHAEMNWRIYYYNGYRECDFVIAQGYEVRQLIQVSWDLSDSDTREREVKGLLEASEKLNCNDLLLITGDGDEEQIVVDQKTIMVKPAWWVLAFVPDFAGRI